MAVTNKDRISRALDLMREGLVLFVERELKARLGPSWDKKLDAGRDRPLPRDMEGKIAWDSQALLKAMTDNWQTVFKVTLGHSERAFTSELLDVRNKFAHEHPFSSDDTHRALDTAQRLLMAVSARKQAEEMEKQKQDLMRSVYAEQARAQTRTKTLTLEGAPKAGLKPWREIVTPHKDVAGGHYRQAEFAADLAQVHRGEGSDEYRDPVEFYRRTYLTEGLRDLIKGALLRLSGQGGEPVVELQTNFGGGKTHSMLALYHLAKAKDARELPGLEGLMTEAGIASVPQCKGVAVLVGTDLSPGQPQRKKDGTVVRTLWGEMAWQLGGKRAYARVAEADATGTNPGNAIGAVLREAAPCLILIDEWVAFVRQLYGVEGLPGGGFDANLTFAQTLSEQAKAVPGCLVVASLPSSDIEIGGEGGREALARLQHTFVRIDRPWKPASMKEGFEIVRRRLFEPIAADDMPARDATIRAFGDLYRTAGGEFPAECAEGDYRRLMEGAFPIHPELFQRLYDDWGALDRFQRTRGVLRLMAAVVHALWERNDQGLMILPASIPLDDLTVEAELVKYVSDAWSAIINQDIDGPSSIPLAIDQEVQALGRYSATRRVARTLFIGSAPTVEGKKPGLDERRVRLGCAQPGETPATFGDALRRLVDRARHLYQEGGQYWFSTQPSIARMADDRAAGYDIHSVDETIVGLLRADRERGGFAAIHVAPQGGSDVSDEPEARLVILRPDLTHGTGGDQLAQKAAEEILLNRGNAPRIFRNALVFLAPDRNRVTELRDAVRKMMAWQSIWNDREALDLNASQTRQAESRTKDAKNTVETRLKETWIWALVPHIADPTDAKIEWQATRIQGQDALAVRTAQKLIKDGALLDQMGPQRLKMKLEQVLWGDAPHIGLKKLWHHHASYLYLDRLVTGRVLVTTIEKGLADLDGPFGFAERYDEATDSYHGLKLANGGSVIMDDLAVLVRPEVARDRLNVPAEPPKPGPGLPPGPGTPPPTGPDTPPVPRQKTRFFASAVLDAKRPIQAFGKIYDEILQHLADLRGAKVEVTIDIQVEAPGGIPDDTQRIVRENAQALKFKDHGFED